MFQKVPNVRFRKKLWVRTEYHDFPSKIFCLGAEKFRWGTLRYIRKVRLSKNFMNKRLITLFSVEFFFTYTASIVRWRTPLCFKIFGTSKTFLLSRGQRNFPSVFLASQYWKTSWVTHSAIHNISVIETFYAWERKIKFFCRIFFVSQYQKNSWWPLLSFRLFGISKTFMHITVFFRFFCLTVPKNYVRNHLMFQKVSNVRYRKILCIRK